MKTRWHLIPVAIALLGGAFAAGCATSGTRSGTSQVARIVADPDSFLHVGMTVEQVRKAMGEPAEIHPLKSSNGRGETWIYKARIYSGDRMIAAKTESVPYFDPFTGETRDIQQPVYTPQTVTVEERLNLLIYDGTVQKWVRTRNTSRKLQSVDSS